MALKCRSSEMTEKISSKMESEPIKHGQQFRGLIKAYKRIMSFAQSVRKLAVCWCSVLAIPAAVLGQNPFSTSGGEYAIAGKLPGDQVHPQADFRANGGYIVWEDYFIDGKGLG